MKRNLKFWTRYTWESAEALLAGAALMAAVSLFGVEGLDPGAFAATVPYFLCLSAVLTVILINTGSQTLYVPLLLSMGETRRNVLLGFHYYRALIIASALAMCAVIWLLVPGEMSAAGLRSVPALLCVLVAASALGSIVGTLFVRWKWVGMILVVLICGVAGGVIGFSSVNGFPAETVLRLTARLAEAPWWLAAAAAAALAADVAFQWLLLRRQEVKL